MMTDRTPAIPVAQHPERTPKEASGASGRVSLFLAGDVMTGRGIDQVLPHPVDPRLYERYVTSAERYVAIAESAGARIPRPVDFAYVWGDALAELERRRPQLRLVNLETAVTKAAEPEPKGINYRMSPENVPVLNALGVDCCILANNHLLDWGRAGLLETLQTLQSAGLRSVGAGRGSREARAPAVLPVPGGRVIVLAFGSPSSGVPPEWAAGEDRPGVNLLPDLASGTLDAIAAEVHAIKRPGDVVVASLHWGGNWGYEIPDRQIGFAHGLIDEAAVDLVYGHSSHHPKAVEVYRDRLILYGCGDFLDDYEGIGGYERYRGDLVLMYFATIRLSAGTLERLSMVPLQIRDFRLNKASPADAAWLRDVLAREGKAFGTRVELAPDDVLALVWG